MTFGQGIDVTPGSALPLGVDDCCDGFNFAVFSRHAERVELLIYADPGDGEPRWTLDLGIVGHRTGDIWHARVRGLKWGQAYAYRAQGPWSPSEGHRFDGTAILLDPYARAVVGPFGRTKAPVDGMTRLEGGRGLIIQSQFDWQGTGSPQIPWAETILYETHVRGLTRHASAQSSHPGTYLGLLDKIPYWRELGVTTVELMPVQTFAHGNAGHDNYWGYETVAFFAPEKSYAIGKALGAEVDEFKTMVRELHRNGMEVILDVVFNHTAEGNEFGPTYSFRGLDNAIYYLLDPANGDYANYSGCGNTLNCSHPIVSDLVMDCLRYWVAEMRVDGFRFDLASILGRDQNGNLMPNPPLLERVAQDPILRDVKLIAEAWDAGGAYQVGRFSGKRWAEWNGPFRDDVRRFWRGDSGMSGAMAFRLCGSADLYQWSGKAPVNSINLITCHDGFTLNDLVSYVQKHNESNGEANRDGADDNFSANYGVEGPTENADILATRRRQMKNLMASLLLSRGVPMILGGDEFGRSQKGNNNAYCQDNALAWYDWRLSESNSELLRFVRELIAFRKRNTLLREQAFLTDAEVLWFGPFGQMPDWNGDTSAFGCILRSQDRTEELCLLFNAGQTDVEFHVSDDNWRRVIDTSFSPPQDIVAADQAPVTVEGRSYHLPCRALAVLMR